MPRERREGRRRRRTREGKGVQKVSAQRATARRKAPGLGDISLVCFPCSSPSSPPGPRGSPQCAAAILPNRTSSSSSSTNQHNTTHTQGEREKNKKSRRAEALPSCAHSTAQRGAAHNEHRHCWLHVRCVLLGGGEGRGREKHSVACSEERSRVRKISASIE